MPGRLYVFALECVCSWFIGFGSSLVSGESVNSVTDGSHSKKAQTPLVADQAFCFVFFFPSHLALFHRHLLHLFSQKDL